MPNNDRGSSLGTRGWNLATVDAASSDGRLVAGSQPSSDRPAGSTVADLTERELIERIQGYLPSPPEWMIVGIGDDAAVLEPERNRLEVLSVDALVEGVHFDRRFVPADAIGHRALAANLSDLAAMGAAPRLALLSFALPAALLCRDFDALVSGIAALALRHKLHVAGGNLTRSPGPLLIDIVVAGTVKRRQALTRGGARSGDDVYVTGTIGAAAAGLEMLKASIGASEPTAADRSGLDAQVAGTADSCIERYLRPEPRIRTGLLLARNRAASACIDLSDGLADGLHQIADSSGVGILVDSDAVPIDPSARAWFESQGANPMSRAISGGDDYELLFTVHPRQRARFKAAERHGATPLTRIGVCTAERSTMLRGTAGAGKIDAPVPRGYTHFR